ncbi:MAG TPA: hypothetical protein VMR86_16775 [Myxococcota bacterium]|nr:hypothetical protein [Myxococcota bacterium]
MDELIRILKRYAARFRDVVTGERVRRALYGVLRRWFPVLRIRNTVWVSGLEDVRDVLGRPDDFSVRAYGVRMRETAGDFLLGHDDAQHAEDRALAQRVMHEIDEAGPGRVHELALALAGKVIEARIAAGDHLDVVKDLADTIPVAVASDYFGIPDPGGRRLLEWVQDMSWYIFNPLASDADRERGIRAGRQLREHVYRSTHVHRPESPTANVLDGLILSRADVDVVVRTLCGLIAGSLGPPPRQFVKAVDHLLDLEGAARAKLHDAAVAGNATAVGQFVREASRLAPDPSLLYRTCERHTSLGEHALEPGRIVVCLIESALLDERAIQRPLDLRIDRQAGEQMMFGYGPHACLGEGMGMELLMGMALPLFALPGLRRADGAAGRVQAGELGTYPAQNYPQHLMVTYEPKPASSRAIGT